MPENIETEPRKVDIHERIRRLRLERKWTQGELASKLGIQQKQISAYERGANNPSTEILMRLANVFDVSLDYLAFDTDSQSTKVQVKDRELLRYFEEIDNFPEEQKAAAKQVLDLIVLKNRVSELAGSSK